MNFTNVGSEVYIVCASLELNSVGMKWVWWFADSDVVNSYGKYCHCSTLSLVVCWGLMAEQDGYIRDELIQRIWSLQLLLKELEE